MKQLSLAPSLDANLITVFLNGPLIANVKGLNLDEATLKRARPTRNHVEETIRRSAEQSGVLQPVFVSELKATMQYYASLTQNSTAAVA